MLSVCFELIARSSLGGGGPSFCRGPETRVVCSYCSSSQDSSGGVRGWLNPVYRIWITAGDTGGNTIPSRLSDVRLPSSIHTHVLHVHIIIHKYLRQFHVSTGNHLFFMSEYCVEVALPERRGSLAKDTLARLSRRACKIYDVSPQSQGWE